MRYIDLFCGIGGFHQAMKKFNGECVMACDIDKSCREVYEKNYGIKPLGDIKEINADDVPDCDLVCLGFPCQPFGHSGHQRGFEDPRGNLFFEACRIINVKKPRFILLENVKNLKGHDEGKTWRTIYKTLVDLGYSVDDDPVVLSPTQFGIPQNRERVYIPCIRLDIGTITPVRIPQKQQTNIDSILCDDDTDEYTITEDENVLLKIWQKFIKRCYDKHISIPSFPVWTEEWDKDYDISDLPVWKQNFITKNRNFYNNEDHHDVLCKWLKYARSKDEFKGAKTKLEWQNGSCKSIWESLIQFRPSGVRIKTMKYSPTLVAMCQIPIVGSKKRRLTPRECARLQSFPDDFPLTKGSYKQFGNSVNVKVVEYVLAHLLKS